MTHLEIIEIRTTGKNNDALEDYLAGWQAEVMLTKNAPLVNIYRHTELETDFSIHVLYDDKIREIDILHLGERLISELKTFGLVNHTVWKELIF